MPILSDFRKTKELTLPSYPESKVIIYSGILFKDATAQGPDEDDFKYSLRILPRFIKEWNFTDEKNEPLPVSEDNISKLKTDDITYLILEMQKFIESEKKN